MMRALVATRKGLFRIDDRRIELLAFAGVPVTNITVDRRDGTWYAAVDHGHFGCKVHRSTDEGRTFTEITAPTYPPKPEGVTETDPVRGDDVPWSTQLIWTIEPGHPDTPEVLWAGTIPGGLFRSADRGDSWELVRRLWDDPTRAEWFGGGYDHPGIHSIAIDPRSADRMHVAISCGGVWHTDDGGASWTATTKGFRAGYLPPEQAENPAVQDPHRIARCAAAPDVLWCQHHSGMWHSTDNGATWDEITGVEPSTFGFAVAAHPADPGVAWFVPAVSDEVRIPVDGRMVVTRTTDGGRTFEALGNGLPANDAYHLVYRHGLDVGDSGDDLVLGSTTGSLWTSGDGGDRFTTISNDLPPVAAVRVL